MIDAVAPDTDAPAGDAGMRHPHRRPGGLARAADPRAWWEAPVERGLVPDRVLRAAIRARTSARLRAVRAGTAGERDARAVALREQLRAGPVTVHTDAANAQHYEVPTRFFELVLGPRLAYSCCLWPSGTTDLAGAEEAMLALAAERAGLADGQRVLDLGCGWGALSLWLAERHPASDILAVSNSRTQREHIERVAAERGLRNVSVQTSDVADLRLDGRFDRIVSVEMLEHVRDHHTVLERVRSWLEPDGRCFVHVFSHRDTAWLYDRDDRSDWVGRRFFSGGMMPSHDLFTHVTGGMDLVDRWWVDGTHYARTGEAWLDRLDAHRDEVLGVLAAALGEHPGRVALARWRLFFLLVAEVWGFRRGSELGVTHVLFAP